MLFNIMLQKIFNKYVRSINMLIVPFFEEEGIRITFMCPFKLLYMPYYVVYVFMCIYRCLVLSSLFQILWLALWMNL